MEPTTRPIQVFLLFDNADYELIQLIEKHCAAMEQKQAISIWHHRDLRPGQLIEQETTRRLAQADIILMMISADLLNSERFHIGEKISLERSRKGLARVLPIYLRHCEFTGYDFTSLKMLPEDNQPVFQTGVDLDKRCAEVAREIHRVVENLKPAEPQNAVANGMPAPDESDEDTTKILYITNNPRKANPVKINEEINCIKQRLVIGKCACRYELIPKNVETLEGLQRALLETRPQIVHFSGYSTHEDKLAFKNAQGASIYIKPRALRCLFDAFKDRLELVFLNACYSEPQARAISKSIFYVIGVEGRYETETSGLSFVKGFYQAIAYGVSIKKAYSLARNLLEMSNLPGFDQIVLFERDREPPVIPVTRKAS